MAIHCFKNKSSVLVPRSRHKQVKKTSQLLTIQSELFEIDQQGMLVMHPKRVPPTEPIIKLGEEFREVKCHFSFSFLICQIARTIRKTIQNTAKHP